MEHKLAFSTSISNFEKINPEFARAKVNVCYKGRNRNFSDIPQTTLDKMTPSIYGIPVVGEWKQETGDFSGHGGKLEITDEGYKMIDTTKPYGFVDPSTPVFYETITEKDGITKRDYLSCYVYLWYKRYPELEKVLSDGAGQSMEISVFSGRWDNDGYYVIEDANFSALCILGVEPCFESSNISTKYSLDKEGFRSEYEDMIKTFKKYTLDTLVEGGNSMEENINEFEQEVVEIVETEQIQEEIVVEETTEIIKTQDEEVKEEIVEEQVNEFDLLKQDYEKMQIEFNELKSKLETLTSDFAKLQEEKEGLAQFKQEKLAEEKKEQESAIFEQYSDLDGIELFEEIKNDTSKFEKVEDLEKEIALIYCKHKANFSKQENTKTTIKIPLEKKEEIKTSPYGDLFDKYLKK